MALPDRTAVLSAAAVFRGQPFADVAAKSTTDTGMVFRGVPFYPAPDSGGGGTTYRCLVLLDGVLTEFPESGPTGMRVILSAGELVCEPVNGVSLVWDRTLGRIREADPSETVITP